MPNKIEWEMTDEDEDQKKNKRKRFKCAGAYRLFIRIHNKVALSAWDANAAMPLNVIRVHPSQRNDEICQKSHSKRIFHSAFADFRHCVSVWVPRVAYTNIVFARAAAATAARNVAAAVGRCCCGCCCCRSLGTSYTIYHFMHNFSMDICFIIIFCLSIFSPRDSLFVLVHGRSSARLISLRCGHSHKYLPIQRYSGWRIWMRPTHTQCSCSCAVVCSFLSLFIQLLHFSLACFVAFVSSLWYINSMKWMWFSL